MTVNNRMIRDGEEITEDQTWLLLYDLIQTVYNFSSSSLYQQNGDFLIGNC